MSTLSNRKQRSIPQNTASTVVENQPVDVVQPLPYLNLRPTSLLLSRLSLITFFILATVTFITNVQRLLDNPYQVYVFKLLRMNESDTDPKAKLLRYIYASAELASLFVTAPWFIYLYMLQNHRPKVAALIKLQEAPIESVQVGVNTKKTDIPLTMVVSTPASVQPSTTLPSATMIRFLNKRIQIARTGALWGSVCLVGLQVTMMHWLWMQTYGKYFWTDCKLVIMSAVVSVLFLVLLYSQQLQAGMRLTEQTTVCGVGVCGFICQVVGVFGAVFAKMREDNNVSSDGDEMMDAARAYMARQTPQSETLFDSDDDEDEDEDEDDDEDDEHAEVPVEENSSVVDGETTNPNPDENDDESNEKLDNMVAGIASLIEEMVTDIQHTKQQ